MRRVSWLDYSLAMLLVVGIWLHDKLVRKPKLPSIEAWETRKNTIVGSF